MDRGQANSTLEPGAITSSAKPVETWLFYFATVTIAFVFSDTPE